MVRVAGTILGKGKPQARLSCPAVHCRAAERRDKQTGLFQGPCSDRLWRTLCTTQSFEMAWEGIGQSKGLSLSLTGCFATSRCLIEVDLHTGTRALMTEQTPFRLRSTETWETPVDAGLAESLVYPWQQGPCPCKLANLRDRRGCINFQPQPHSRIELAGKPSVGAERYLRSAFQATGDRKMPEWFISPITNITSLRCGALARSH